MTAHRRSLTWSAWLRQLSNQQTPALIWYSAPGERVELSGRVLENWVAKTSAFLEDELLLEEGSSLALTGRLHWRSLILALAALRLGVELLPEEEASQADALATFDANLAASLPTSEVLLLEAQPLAMRYMGQLPAGVLDYLAEVRSYPDVYLGLSPDFPAGQAWPGMAQSQLLAQLEAESARLADVRNPGQAAYLLEAQALTPASLTEALAALLAGYSLLLLDPLAPWPADRLEQVKAQERA